MSTDNNKDIAKTTATGVYGDGNVWVKEPEQQIDRDTELLKGLDNTKKLPANFNMGRAVGLQLAALERDLFTDSEEKESGNAIVSGIETKINDYDFRAFSMGIAKILYNQSYQSGNVDTNSGLIKEVAQGITPKTPNAEKYYNGTVVVTLNDICRDAYGTDTPSTEQRRAITKLLKTLHHNEVHIDFPNGDSLDAVLCATMTRYKRASDSAITYSLSLHPIFTYAVTSNFAPFPQDTTKRLALATKRQTAAHLRLLTLLGMQDKRKPYVRTYTELLKDMGLTDAYKANPTRTEKQTIEIFKTMKDIGIVSDCKIDRLPTKRKKIAKVTFVLNEAFSKSSKE